MAPDGTRLVTSVATLEPEDQVRHRAVGGRPDRRRARAPADPQREGRASAAFTRRRRPAVHQRPPGPGQADGQTTRPPRCGCCPPAAPRRGWSRTGRRASATSSSRADAPVVLVARRTCCRRRTRRRATTRSCARRARTRRSPRSCTTGTRCGTGTTTSARTQPHLFTATLARGGTPGRPSLRPTSPPTPDARAASRTARRSARTGATVVSGWRVADARGRDAASSLVRDRRRDRRAHGRSSTIPTPTSCTRASRPTAGGSRCSASARRCRRRPAPRRAARGRAARRRRAAVLADGVGPLAARPVLAAGRGRAPRRRPTTTAASPVFRVDVATDDGHAGDQRRRRASPTWASPGRAHAYALKTSYEAPPHPVRIDAETRRPASRRPLAGARRPRPSSPGR